MLPAHPTPFGAFLRLAFGVNIAFAVAMSLQGDYVLIPLGTTSHWPQMAPAYYRLAFVMPLLAFVLDRIDVSLREQGRVLSRRTYVLLALPFVSHWVLILVNAFRTQIGYRMLRDVGEVLAWTTAVTAGLAVLTLLAIGLPLRKRRTRALGMPMGVPKWQSKLDPLPFARPHRSAFWGAFALYLLMIVLFALESCDGIARPIDPQNYWPGHALYENRLSSMAASLSNYRDAHGSFTAVNEFGETLQVGDSGQTVRYAVDFDTHYFDDEVINEFTGRWYTTARRVRLYRLTDKTYTLIDLTQPDPALNRINPQHIGPSTRLTWNWITEEGVLHHGFDDLGAFNPWWPLLVGIVLGFGLLRFGAPNTFTPGLTYLEANDASDLELEPIEEFAPANDSDTQTPSGSPAPTPDDSPTHSRG